MANVDPLSIDKTKLSDLILPFENRLARITLRKVLLKLHLYLTMSLGLFLVLAGLTGSLLVYGQDIDRWLNNETMLIEASEQQRLPLFDLIAAANQASPIKSQPAHLQLPTEADEALIVRYQVPMENHGGGHQAKGHNHHFHEVMLNPYTGQVLGHRDRNDALMTTILRLHFQLLTGETGKLIMGIVAIASVILTLTGIYLWWPKLNKIKQAFVIKRNASFTRFNFDLHKTSGIYTAIILFVVSFSGVYFNFAEPFKAVVNSITPLTESPRMVKSATASGTPLPMEKVIDIARLRYPNAEAQRVFLPANPQGSYQVTLHQAGEMTEKGRTMLWIDQYSGDIINTRDPLNLNAGDSFINLQLPLHNGEIIGTTGRILVLITGIAPLLLMVTGVIHWLKKRKAKQVHKTRLRHS
jgi:uncharacterized iron-regulated membrane protein